MCDDDLNDEEILPLTEEYENEDLKIMLESVRENVLKDSEIAEEVVEEPFERIEPTFTKRVRRVI